MATLPLSVRMLELAASLTELGLVWLVQSSFILLAGLAAGWLIARRGPALQSALYRMTLAAVAACPLIAWLLSSTDVVSGLSILAFDVVVLDDPSTTFIDESSVRYSNRSTTDQTPNPTAHAQTENEIEPPQRFEPAVLSDPSYFAALSSNANTQFEPRTSGAESQVA